MIDPSTFVVPVEKGEMPLSPPQFMARINDRRRRVLPDDQMQFVLAAGGQTAAQLGQVMQGLMQQAEANNAFNHQLAAYRTAVARLARYPLAQGRVAIYEDQPRGQIDEDGNPITESVMVSPQIDPLPAMITQEIRDPDTGQVTGTEEVSNPAIETDEAERAAAQAVIDGTPQNVKDYDND